MAMFIQLFTATLFLGGAMGGLVVTPITVTSDVDSACFGGIPRVCPGTIVTFTCTTTDTSVLIWRTSTTSDTSVIFTTVGNNVTAMSSLGSFTAELVVEEGMSLTSTLTVVASEAGGASVTCRDNPAGNEQSADVPQFVLATPTGQEGPVVNPVSNSLDCSAGTEDFTVTWECPANTGDTAITSFTVSTNDADPQTYNGTVRTSYPIPLDVSLEHTISVRANNCIGTGQSAVAQLPSQVSAPSAPVMLAASLNCQSTLDTIRVTWTEPDTNLRCPVTSRTVSAVNIRSSSDSLSCTNSQSPSICSGSIAGATYDVTVAVASDLPVSQNNPSTQSFQVTIRRFEVNSALRQMPDACIVVTLEERCEGDHGEYGVDLLYQDSSASSIMRFEQSDTICVPIIVGQTFSVRLYFIDDVLEQMDELTTGCLREGLTGDGVTVSPDQDSYTNGVEVIHGCKSGFDLSGPEQRTCQAGAWDPPLCMCKETTCKGLSTGEAVGISVVISCLVAFSAGVIVTSVVAYCYISKRKREYSPRDLQQPAPMYEEVPAQSGKIELQENVAYGPLSH